MHRYLLRLRKILFERIEVEASSRGVSVNDMMNELLEIGLLKIYEMEGKHGKVKFEQIDS